jgi:crotonobetainyl-CoA:carnitine CoA-transferase CaiB-like acyl-CoA transferase
VSSYDFLRGLLVVEVAKLGPAALGGFLADMGACVVKVESPSDGDSVRYAGAHAVGGATGFGFLHLRWNRGKQSLGLDLRSAEGTALFKRLVSRADVVIEGMRAGILDRLDLGYEALRQVNPKLVYCSLSGLGLTGPYARRGSHGPSFDAFGGLAPAPREGSISRYQGQQPTAVGMYAMGLHGALGVLAAVFRAGRTGEGALIEVAAADAAAHWVPDALDPLLNRGVAVERRGFADSKGRMTHWPRMDYYRTRDGQVLLFQGFSEKFWHKFWVGLERPDLDEIHRTAASPEAADERLSAALTELFATKSFDEWIAFLDGHDIPVMKVNSFEDVIRDPHFLARSNTYEVEHPDVGTLRLTSTPVKTRGQGFSPTLAPTLGEHTDDILSTLLALSPADISRLRAAGAVA